MKVRIVISALVLAFVLSLNITAQPGGGLGGRDTSRKGGGPGGKDRDTSHKDRGPLDSLRRAKKAEMDAIRKQIHLKAQELRDAVKNGTMTHEEARKAMHEFMQSLRAKRNG